MTDGHAHGLRLAAIVVSLLLAMFLVALDNVSAMLGEPLRQLTKALARPSSARPSPRSRMSSTT